MNAEISAKSSNASPVNWIASGMALSCLAILECVMAVARNQFRPIFQDFKADLPALTKALCSVPGWASLAIVALLGLAVIAMQLLAPAKRRAAFFHLSVIILCIVVIGLYIFALFQPMIALIDAMSGRPAGH